MGALAVHFPPRVWRATESVERGAVRPRMIQSSGPGRGGCRVDDLRLIRGTLRGRREDFGVLVERYQKPLYAFVLRYSGDSDVADDIVQTSFERAYRALRTFRGDALFKTWLHQIALNECRSRDRKQKRLREVALDEIGVAGLPADSPDMVAVVDGNRLSRYIDRLPPRQKSVLTLRIFGDLAFKEVARIEGISEGAAKVNYHHAVKRLKEWMS